MIIFSFIMIYLSSYLSRALNYFTPGHVDLITTKLGEIALRTLDVISNLPGLSSLSLEARQVHPIQPQMDSLCEESEYIDSILKCLAETKLPPEEFRSEDPQILEKNQKFIGFLIDLVNFLLDGKKEEETSEKITDHYVNFQDKLFSKSEIQNVQSTMFKIMNHLFERKEKDGFKTTLQNVVSRIVLVLDQRSDQIIREVESTLEELRSFQ